MIVSGIVFPDAGAWRIPVFIAGCVAGIASAICYFFFHWKEEGYDVPTQPISPALEVRKVHEVGHLHDVCATEVGPVYLHARVLPLDWIDSPGILPPGKLCFEIIDDRTFALQWLLNAYQRQPIQDEMIQIITRLAEEPISLEFEITARGNLLVRSHASAGSSMAHKDYSGYPRIAKDREWIPRLARTHWDTLRGVAE